MRRPDGVKLGEHRRLMIDKVTGRVSLARDGLRRLPRLGEKHHAVAWDKLTYEPKLGAL